MGYYSLIDGVLRLAAAPTARETIEAIKFVAERARSGEIPSTEAVSQIENLNPSLGNAISRYPLNQINWELVVAVLSLLYAFWTSYSSDEQVHAALKEAQTQTELSRQIVSALEEQNNTLNELASRSAQQSASPTQSNDGKNRTQRRKEAAIERRRGKRDK